MIFLRPWLILLLIFPILMYFIKRKFNQNSIWKKNIDKKLRPYVLTHKKSKSERKWKGAEFLLWILLTIAAMGPAWNKIEVPTQTKIPGTVIIVELAPNLSRSNLTQTQIKLYDLLSQLKNEQVGLVLYDNNGYTAVPLTPDLEIIKNVVPALSPDVLPEVGLQPIQGFKQAHLLFQNAGLTSGRILFITTGAFNIDSLKKYIQTLPYSVGILGIGSENGKPIPLPQGGFLTDEKGHTLLSHLKEQELNQFSVYQKATTDENDIKKLVQSTKAEDSLFHPQKDKKTKTSIWQDQGIYFLIFALPLFCLLFRKGIYFVLILALWSTPIEAGFWKRSDQEQYQKNIQAIQAYRSQKYSVAEKLFKQNTDADSLYNQGNALAQQQKIDEALISYDRALKLNPHHTDAAFNKAYLEKQKEKQSQREQDKQQSSQESQKPESNDKGNNSSAHNQQNTQNESLNQSQEESQSNKASSESKTNSENEKAQTKSEKENESEKGNESNKSNTSPEESSPNDQPIPQQNLSNNNQERNHSNNSSLKEEKQSFDTNKGNQNSPQKQSINNPETIQNNNDSDKDRHHKTSDEEMKSQYDLEKNNGQNKETATQPKQETTQEISLNKDETQSHPQKEEEPLFDQKSQQILNRLKSNPTQVLRYRIYQQYHNKQGRK